HPSPERPPGPAILEKGNQMKLILVIPPRKTSHRADRLEGAQHLLVQNPAAGALKLLHMHDLPAAVECNSDRRNPFDAPIGRLGRIAPDPVDCRLEAAQERAEEDIIAV